MNSDDAVREFVQRRISERGSDYALRLAGDPKFFDSEIEDIKEFLCYEHGIEFADE